MDLNLTAEEIKVLDLVLAKVDPLGVIQNIATIRIKLQELVNGLEETSN